MMEIDNMKIFLTFLFIGETDSPSVTNGLRYRFCSMKILFSYSYRV
jgi:hypothetical protein